MDEETIVAVFDTADHAAAAVRDLEAAGVPASAITQHAGMAGGVAGGQAVHPAEQAPREQGFWSSLFGGEPDYAHDAVVYDRSLQTGSTVVTVRVGAAHQDQAINVLERHNPIDIEERAASYGLSAPAARSGSSAGATQASASSPARELGAEPAVGQMSTLSTSNTGATSAATQAGVTAGGPDNLTLSEETLAVGKRAVNRGTTRVRRYVVETPVEEAVSLRDEHVSVERHPVTDGRAVKSDSFGDRTIEMTETAEEAVVSKQARVREEVVIRKEETDRTETVRDTVRREDVEITKEPGTSTTATGNTVQPGPSQGKPLTSAPYKPAS